MPTEPRATADPKTEETYLRLVTELGYASSPAFIEKDEDPRTAHLYRLAAKAKVFKTYTVSSSEGDRQLPRVPIVFVARASNETEARQIRRELWCLGQAPFTIIVLPGQVRAYANSKFDAKRDKVGEIGVWLDYTEEISSALQQLHAEEIDTGRVWLSRSEDIHTEGRVDWHLLNNLRQLSKHLRSELHLPLETAHALIGKYIYIRYLRDRQILTDKWLVEQQLDPDSVLAEHATLEGLRRFVEALDRRFNGSVFPLDLYGPSAPSNQAISLVARAMSGQEPWSEQAVFDFSTYDFSFIPVETLSVIYEQFLGERDAQRVAGAFYTPEPVAEYLLSEIAATAGIAESEKILDPSCGSGIFLVLYYRQLIERRIRETGETPCPDDLKNILQSCIFGVERNQEACYVTEFSLLLTLLSYVNPPQLEKQGDFHFPSLHNENIFHTDFFDLESRFGSSGLRFTWIVGNPPWTELEPTRDDSRLAIEYINKVSSQCNIKRYRVHEAFMWRAREFLAPNGWIAFIIQATSLTNEQSEAFRRSFFSHNEVRRVSNFSNFAYRLFPSSQAPAFTIVYRPRVGQSSEPIVHYGPFVADQLQLQALKNKQGTPVISIYEADIRTIDPREAASGKASVWKRALWATYRDEKAFREYRRYFASSLKGYMDERGWNVRLGIQLRCQDAQEPIDYKEELERLPLLSPRKFRETHSSFEVTAESLEVIPESCRYIRRRGGVGGLKVSKAPHVFLTATFAAYSELDFVLPHPQVGIAAPAHDATYLRAITLLLWSSAVRFLLFFESPSWGIFTSTFGVNPARRLPLPLLSEQQAEELSKVHARLAGSKVLEQTLLFDEGEEGEESLVPQVGASVQDEIDDAVARVIGLPKHLDVIARDFMQVRYQLNKGKRPAAVLGLTTEPLLEKYGQILLSELDSFAGVLHSVELVQYSKYTTCRVTLFRGDTHRERRISIASSSRSDHGELWNSLKEQHTQWVYTQRSFRQADRDSILLIKPNRKLDWTESRALIDSDDIIADLINEAHSP